MFQHPRSWVIKFYLETGLIMNENNHRTDNTEPSLQTTKRKLYDGIRITRKSLDGTILIVSVLLLLTLIIALIRA